MEEKMAQEVAPKSDTYSDTPGTLKRKSDPLSTDRTHNEWTQKRGNGYP